MTNVLLLYILSALWSIIALLQKDPTLTLVDGWLSSSIGLIGLVAFIVHMSKDKK